ncbi:hypothetical protein H6F76_12575 [Leptolyngbya sp. FACHB-321]|uniref:hypothetical protein n=1 Tax=Leptolyngbya sp. FACHB-321 TaxID=2692807 RepID=UPI001685B0D2|nr:hypothetical protein [Leptolyngbya sp. FACHB-321]MBD2035854.1 hypothetical protein [Leptolyngbya sp. FACHB-321]
MTTTNRERAEMLLKAYDDYLAGKQARRAGQPSCPSEASAVPFRVRSLLWLLPMFQA